MFTTGFKFFFGTAMVLAVAAVIYGYASGGDTIGPISLGWKGGVGEHLGYGVLVALSSVSMVVSFFMIAFRDADARSQAEVAGVDYIGSAPRVTPSIWPAIGAIGVATMAVGLVLNTLVFIAGVIVVAIVLIEWMMDAWADRATGDPAANKELRDRIMAPIEVPVIGVLLAGVGILAVSRIFIAVSADMAVLIAGVVSVLILVIAVIYASRPQLGRTVVAGSSVVLVLAVLTGAVVAAAIGERDIEEHDAEHGAEEEHAAEEELTSDEEHSAADEDAEAEDASGE